MGGVWGQGSGVMVRRAIALSILPLNCYVYCAIKEIVHVILQFTSSARLYCSL
jgi:hypothetical protein